MTVTDLDLAELRRIAEAVCVPEPWAIWHDLDHQGFKTVGDAESYAEVLAGGEADEADPIAHVYTDDLAEHIAAFDPPTVLALLDRIESLEAERDGLMVTNERLLSYSQKAEARIKELKARLARVTAQRDDARDVALTRGRALARVTDDSMLAALMRVQYTGHGRGKPEVMRDVLATIRAVAADEQEAGR